MIKANVNLEEALERNFLTKTFARVFIILDVQGHVFILVVIFLTLNV